MSSQRVVGLVLRVWVFGCACLAGGALATGGSVRTLDESSCDRTRGADPAPCDAGNTIGINPCSDIDYACTWKGKDDCKGNCFGCNSTDWERCCDWLIYNPTSKCKADVVLGGCGEYWGVAGKDGQATCSWNGMHCECKHAQTTGKQCGRLDNSLSAEPCKAPFMD
jgi:hypothetical protein